MIQGETCSIFQLLSGCQQTAPQSALELWGERKLFPPSFSSSCPNRFQTGFPYHTDTLNNVARCRVCPLSGYYCEQLKFLPPHRHREIHIAQLLQPNTLLNCGSKCEQPVLEMRHTSVLLHVLWGYGEQGPETYLFETLRDWSVVADNHLGEETSRIGQAHHWAAHHCSMMDLPHPYARFNIHHHNFIFTSDIHDTENGA